ncbi:MAG: 2-phospho-L-lactate transferase [Pseudorhodoplanes sp.]
MSDRDRREPTKVLALCGGIGGAKLALGLYRILEPDHLTVVINTGDDFAFLGLSVSPDIDTVTYTLAGISNEATGWGRDAETWNCIANIEMLGGEAWFKLGDKDLAVHIERTRRLRAGETMTQVTADFAARLGISARLLPMSDDPVRTMVRTPDRTLGFQEYFVKLQCGPAVTAIAFEGAQAARPAFLQNLADPDLDLVVICPSNPYLSIDPILALPGVRRTLEDCAVPVVAVSPIVGGQAVKGPTAKIMNELGIAVTQSSIVRHYKGFIDGIVVDEADSEEEMDHNVPVESCKTLMKSMADREALAKNVIAFGRRLAILGGKSEKGA